MFGKKTPFFSPHRMKGNFGTFVDLQPGNLVYLGPVDLTVYFIKHMDMASVTFDDDGTFGIQVSITLGRRLLGVFLTTYLPTFLLLIIVHATHYFKPFFFEAIVTVNLTCK